MLDPAEWIPKLLRDAWDRAVDSLREEGVDVTINRGEIWGAHDRRSGGELRGLVRVKVYESGDLVHTRVTHGDVDKDMTWRWSIDIQCKDGGDQARKRAHDANQVITRVLELYRRNPNEDWDAIEDVASVTPNNYADYQQRVISLTLYRAGKVLPKRTPPITS